MKAKHDISAVILNLSVNGLGVARALCRNGVPVVGVAKEGGAPGADSGCVRQVWRHDGGPGRLVDLLIRRAGEFPAPPVLFPITDQTVRAIAVRLDDVLGKYRIGMPDPAVVESSMSKRGFATWARKLDLPVPRSIFVDGLEALHQAAEQVDYPCIVKPEFQSSADHQVTGLKAHRADDRQSLIDGYSSFRDVEPRAVIQEWIPGGDHDVFFCLQYYSTQGRLLVSFCGH